MLLLPCSTEEETGLPVFTGKDPWFPFSSEDVFRGTGSYFTPVLGGLCFLRGARGPPQLPSSEVNTPRLSASGQSVILMNLFTR